MSESKYERGASMYLEDLIGTRMDDSSSYVRRRIRAYHVLISIN
jgi:hypothetical protein